MEDNPGASEPFTGSPGPSDEAKEQETPLNYLYMLQMLLGPDIFHYIADQTSIYAAQKGMSLVTITPAEIAAFMGVNIAMGIVNLPSVHEY